MIVSWRRQQLSRNFRHETIAGRQRTVRRFADFTGHFPWEQTFSGVDDYFAHTLRVELVAGYGPRLVRKRICTV
jgi:integrase/recombinase XerD